MLKTSDLKLEDNVRSSDINPDTVRATDAPSTTVNLTSRRKLWPKILMAFVLILLLVAGCILYVYHWYNQGLKPLSPTQQRVTVTVQKGMTASEIGRLLADKGVIRSGTVFYLYTRNSHNLTDLQAGTYLLSPSQSVKSIVQMLSTGQTNLFNVIILPGQNLSQIKTQLIKDGFESSDIDKAFAADYNYDFLRHRPVGASLEGYIFPDTYQIDTETTVKELLDKTFANFQNKLKIGYRPQKSSRLNLHQMITLASIVQLEDSRANMQPQIAQVFLSRLENNMPLGSDVTAIYGAKLAGYQMTPTEAVAYNSPYNTRMHKGLPPGPIANFDWSALASVIHPAKGNYLFFVAGDDGVIHFAQTNAEHQQNVAKYCHKLCQQ